MPVKNAPRTKKKLEDDLLLSGHRSSFDASAAVSARKKVRAAEQKLSVTSPWAGSFQTPPRDIRKELSSEVNKLKTEADLQGANAVTSREEYKKKWQAAYKKSGGIKKK